MYLRDVYCGEVKEAQIGELVTLNGWVQRRRDHGKLIFLDLRDRSGLIQVVFNFEPELTTTMGVPKKLVIDGQQRLTTITILLTAIRNFLKANDSVRIKETSHEEIQDLYLFNPHKSGEDKFKLLLTKKDKETLIQILDFIPLTEHGSNVS